MAKILFVCREHWARSYYRCTAYRHALEGHKVQFTRHRVPKSPHSYDLMVDNPIVMKLSTIRWLLRSGCKVLTVFHCWESEMGTPGHADNHAERIWLAKKFPNYHYASASVVRPPFGELYPHLTMAPHPVLPVEPPEEKKGDVSMLLAGRWDGNKNLLTAVMAAKRLKMKITNLTTFPVHRFGIEHEQIGPLPHDQFINLLRTRKFILCAPSFQENLCLAAIESLTAGNPVVGTAQYLPGSMRPNPLDYLDVADKVEAAMEEYEDMAEEAILLGNQMIQKCNETLRTTVDPILWS